LLVSFLAHALPPGTAQAVHAAAAAAVCVAACAAALAALNFAERRAAAALAAASARLAGPLETAATAAAAAAARPALVVLPFVAAAVAAEAAALVLARAAAAGAAAQLAAGLRAAAALAQDSAELAAIAFVASFLHEWKELLVAAALARAAANPRGDPDALALLLRPVSSLLSWAGAAAAAVAAARVCGVRVAPLIAGGGAATLATGLAIQSLLANVVAGVALRAAGVFVPGDRVALKTLSGGNVAAGVVAQLLPLAMVLRDDVGALHFVPNKEVRNMLLVRPAVTAAAAASAAPAAASASAAAAASASAAAAPSAAPGHSHELAAELVVRYADVDALPAAEAAATAWLRAQPGVVAGAPCGVALARFGAAGPVVAVRALVEAPGAAGAPSLLYGVERALRSAGVFLAVEFGGLPPPRGGA
jgi:small-conductance mechanosensitive channel